MLVSLEAGLPEYSLVERSCVRAVAKLLRAADALAIAEIWAPTFDSLAESALSLGSRTADTRPLTMLELSMRSEEHTSELQSLMRISYAVFCLKKKKKKQLNQHTTHDINTTKQTTLHTMKKNKTEIRRKYKTQRD